MRVYVPVSREERLAEAGSSSQGVPLGAGQSVFGASGSQGNGTVRRGREHVLGNMFKGLFGSILK